MSARILFVEDDRELIRMIALCLKRHGFRALQASTGEAGLDLVRQEQPDLVILDVGLPGISGLEVCAHLRKAGFDRPILMLTSRNEIDDRVAGLEAGADDYLAKPFAVREFVARIQALLRRRERRARPSTLHLGDVQVDLAARRASRAGEALALTKTEFALLDILLRHAGEPISRERMLDEVWGYTRFPTTRTIDTHIWRLRKKLGDDGAAPRWLKLVHGQGYCLELE